MGRVGLIPGRNPKPDLYPRDGSENGFFAPLQRVKASLATIILSNYFFEFHVISDVDPILILTHGDMLQPMERLNCRIKICNYLGIPVTTGAYDIVCLTEQGILAEESDPITSFALTEAIYRILLQSDRTHPPKRKYKDWITDFLSRIMCSLAYFFAMISRIFQRWGDKHKIA